MVRLQVKVLMAALATAPGMAPVPMTVDPKARLQVNNNIGPDALPRVHLFGFQPGAPAVGAGTNVSGEPADARERVPATQTLSLTPAVVWDTLPLNRKRFAMKKRLSTLISVFALLAFVGCSDKNIDTAKIRTAMQSLDDAQKTQLEAGLTAIDQGRYKDALLPLRKVAFGAKLTKDQGKVLKDAMDKLNAKIAAGQ